VLGYKLLAQGIVIEGGYLFLVCVHNLPYCIALLRKKQIVS